MPKRFDQWLVLIEEFKADTDVMNIVYLADNLDAMRVLAVWSYQVLDVSVPKSDPPKEKNRQWEWLWESVESCG